MIENNPSLLETEGIDIESVRRYLSRKSVNSNGDVPPCTDAIGPYTFFNTLNVKKALHVDTSVEWTMCSDKITRNYTRSKTGSYNLYPNLVNNGLRIWIYSGDTDGAVPTAGTMYWFNKLVT